MEVAGGVKAILILDQQGERVLAQYYDDGDHGNLMAEEQQRKFEKTLFQKAHKANSEIIQLDDLICVYRPNIDHYFYVIGRAQENAADDLLELLHTMLDYIVHACTEPLVTPPQLGLSLLSAFRDQQRRKQQQQSNKKAKRKQDEADIERRASKGRRIRYVEIPKLVNFFPAMPELTSWTHERRNELFKSLFV